MCIRDRNKASQTYLLGKHIELGDEKDTTEIKDVNSKRITRQSGNIFLRSKIGNLPTIAGVAQASFLGGNRKSLTRIGEYRGGQ